MKNGISVAATKLVGTLGAAATLVLIAAHCFGGVLAPGGEQGRPGTSLAPSPYSTSSPFASYTSVGTLTSNFVTDIGDIDGTVTSTVYQNPADGTLGFNYLFTRTGGVSDLARATIGSLSNPWLGVTISDTGAYGTGSSTAAPLAPDWADGYPLFLSRAAASSGAGISITWESGNQGTYLNSSVNSASGRNDYSADIFFVTDATAYAATNVGLLDSGAVSQSQALAPSGVPEPASLVMIIFGLAGMGLLCLARRRRANARAVLDAESEIDEPWVISLPQAEACRSKRLAA